MSSEPRPKKKRSVTEDSRRGEDAGADYHGRSPRRRRNSWLAFAVVVVVVWVVGSSESWLPAGLTEECAVTLLGGEVCGDDLLAFCQKSYDPEINADVCDGVLSDAGTSGPEVLAGRRATSRERHRRAVALARTRVGIGQPRRLGDVVYTVRSARWVSQLQGSLDEVILPQAGRRFFVARVSYKNVGRTPLDLLCGGATNFRLLDSRSRVFSTDEEAMIEHELNDEACVRKAQPGDLDTAAVVFQVSDAVTPVDLLIGRRSGPPPPGAEPYLAIPVKSAGENTG